MKIPVAPGAPRADLTLDEGTQWGFVIWQTEDGTGPLGPREAFLDGTTAYMDVRVQAGAAVAILRLGPAGSGFDVDGTISVDEAQGEIRGLLNSADAATGLPFPVDAIARYDLFVVDAGDAVRRRRYLKGHILYPAQITTSPGA